jgi:hypothetical protein
MSHHLHLRPALRLAVLLATATAACALPVSPGNGSDSLGTTEAPIEGGQPINTGSDVVSRAFPLYTVWLSSGCTGVIVSQNQILTAAHCQVDESTDVEFYPLWPSTGNTPLASPTRQIDTTQTMVEPGVNCPATLGTGCYSYTGKTHYADLEILTLTDNVPSGYQAVTLGAALSYNNANLGGVLSGSMWLAGTGNMNQDKQSCPVKTASNTTTVYNLNHMMQWVVLDGLGASDTGATVPLPVGGDLTWPDGSTAVGLGMFTTTLRGTAYSDPGDSGGPVFQYQLLGSGSVLALVGLNSGGIDCTNAPVGSYIDWYTSVVEFDNFTWLTTRIPTIVHARLPGPQDVSGVASFGAAL